MYDEEQVISINCVKWSEIIIYDCEQCDQDVVYDMNDVFLFVIDVDLINYEEYLCKIKECDESCVECDQEVKRM